MSYQATVYKIFIASPSDVANEREIVRSVIARWNAYNAESHRIILLPIGWDTHSAPESGRTAQEYINEEVLEKCDILIGIFWSKIGSPTKNAVSGTVAEINQHIGERKLSMLYFSNKPLPPDVDLEQIKHLRALKERCRNESLYGEFENEYDLAAKLYDHIQIKISEGKFRPVFDSDILAKISDNNELIKQIGEYYPIVAKNLLISILDDDKPDEVWDAIVDKLSKSPPDLRDSLLLLAKRGAFRHKVFVKGYLALANCSQPDFGYFISELYSLNKYEFRDIWEQNLLEDCNLARRLSESIKKHEQQ